jgi:RNA-binding protein NOB1
MAGVLPYELKFREPTPRSMGIVAEFARETGDFHGLSAVDLKVLALTHTLTVERNGDGGINTKPVISIRDAPKSSSRHGWFVPGVDAAEGGGTSANTTTDALPSDEPKPDPADPVKLAADAAASWGGNWDAEKSEDDRGWITPGNREAVVKTLGRKENHVKAVVRVGCVTADFSMQNVLLQMGMNVVSVDGAWHTLQPL